MGVVAPTRVRIAHDGQNVILDIAGRVHSLPWDQARVLWMAIRQHAQAAEEIALHQQMIEDQAILTKTPLHGIIGLATSEKIRAEAKKSAQWDSKYRKIGSSRFAESREAAYPPTLWPAEGRK